MANICKHSECDVFHDHGETADVSNKKQLCSRWVDDCFVIHENFIGMHPLKRANPDQVVGILKNALPRINLNIQLARGQCYDGVATKAGEKAGVATLYLLESSSKRNANFI